MIITLELKILADVAVSGFPKCWKSTLCFNYIGKTEDWKLWVTTLKPNLELLNTKILKHLLLQIFQE